MDGLLCCHIYGVLHLRYIFNSMEVNFNTIIIIPISINKQFTNFQNLKKELSVF
jgi:hypothetical protein